MAVVQVGWVTAPALGAAGVTGCVFTTIFADGVEVQPATFVTVKVYVPALAVTNPVAEILNTTGVKL